MRNQPKSGIWSYRVGDGAKFTNGNQDVDIIVRRVDGPFYDRTVDLEIRGVGSLEELTIKSSLDFTDVDGNDLQVMVPMPKSRERARVKKGNRTLLCLRNTGKYSFVTPVCKYRDT